MRDGGVLCTNGHLLNKDYVPAESENLVRNLEKSGAIVIGKTNVPELCAGGNSFNKLFPSTRTPFDTRRTSGGSSGGSAAALAAGQAWLATGSDLAGSLRTPAAFCGVVSIRASPGRVPCGTGKVPPRQHRYSPGTGSEIRADVGSPSLLNVTRVEMS